MSKKSAPSNDISVSQNQRRLLRDRNQANTKCQKKIRKPIICSPSCGGNFENIFIKSPVLRAETINNILPTFVSSYSMEEAGEITACFIRSTPTLTLSPPSHLSKLSTLPQSEDFLVEDHLASLGAELRGSKNLRKPTLPKKILGAMSKIAKEPGKRNNKSNSRCSIKIEPVDLGKATKNLLDLTLPVDENSRVHIDSAMVKSKGFSYFLSCEIMQPKVLQTSKSSLLMPGVSINVSNSYN